MNLEAMRSGFNNSPFMPYTPPHDTSNDLKWWAERLQCPTLSRNIPGPVPLTDLNAFLDTSSGFGISIMIRDKWRAWCLLPGWKFNGRDISWAEAVGFELLSLFILSSGSGSTHFKVYGDNKGVIEGWWKGHSQNKQANIIFQCIHTVLHTWQCTIHTSYVPSQDNPADNLSRGVYLPFTHLLPYIPIPPELCTLITDFDSKLPSPGPDQHLPSPTLPKPFQVLSDNKCTSINAELDCQKEEFLSCSSYS